MNLISKMGRQPVPFFYTLTLFKRRIDQPQLFSPISSSFIPTEEADHKQTNGTRGIT